MKPVKRGFPKKWAITFYVVLGAATLGVLMWMHLDRQDVTPLSPDERADLAEVDAIAGKQLRHPTLGFTLAHPGPKFFASKEAEAKLGFGHDPSTRFHAYTELESGRMVIVALSKRTGMSGGAFERAVTSVTNMFTQKTAAGFAKGAAVDFPQNDIDRDGRRATVHAVVAATGHLRIDARVLGDYLLMVIGVSPKDDSLAPIVASVK
jgi:hypothetical protein